MRSGGEDERGMSEGAGRVMRMMRVEPGMKRARDKAVLEAGAWSQQ